MAILGLMDTESFSSQRFTNVRRSVFYFYPNGAAPLVGLLSLLDEEDSNDPKFSHWEKRLSQQRTTTASQGSSKGPFKNSSDADNGDATTWTAGTVYIVVVADNSMFRVGHVVKIGAPTVSNTASATDLLGVVTELPSTTGTGKVKMRAINTLAGVDNGTTNENVGKEALVVGNSYAQGVTDQSSDIYNLPVQIENYLQIFRSPFSFTGSALKTAAKFDESGPYKDKSKETSILHMIEMEKNFIFGEKLLYTGGATPQYMTGGILYFLRLWEAGSTYGNTAATADTDDTKRIIENTGGTTNEKTYDKYLERAFRVTNNKTNEKLVLCGSGFLMVINQMYRNKTVLNAQQGEKTTFGMPVVSHVSSFGTVHYRTHPLFSDNAALRYNALFLDVHNLKYRYLQGRDTELLTNRQPNDADYRKDEWLSEAGMECRFPESHLYLKNITDYVQ